MKWLYVPDCSSGTIVEHAFERLRRDSFTSLCGLVETRHPPQTAPNYEGRPRCLMCTAIVEEG